MRTRLRHLWERLSSGYWFVPTLMMAAAVALALGLLYADRRFVSRGGDGFAKGWLYSGGADGARALLSTIAGTVITVAGVVFSITIAALSQASSQFGPRMLRNFMRDLGNQAVLGTFTATFVYCMLVLRTIHGRVGEDDAGAFVPHMSVTVAVVLGTASIAVLVYFIHHVSVSLQVPAVIAAVQADFDRVIARLPEEERGTAVPADVGRHAEVERDADLNPNARHLAAGLPPDFEATARPIPAAVQGYVQAIDFGTLLAIAQRGDLVLRLACRPGDYVIAGNPLAWAWPADRCVGGKFAEAVNDAHLCGRHATPEQDLEYAVRQLVEIAVRALSPAINDPFTAINCLDALGAALCRIATVGLPGPYRHDAAGRLRVVTPVTTFAGLVDTAFHQIRQYSRNNVAVTARLLETIEACADRITNPTLRRPLRRHAEMVYQQSLEAIPDANDRADIQRRWERVARLLGEADSADRPQG